MHYIKSPLLSHSGIPPPVAQRDGSSRYRPNTICPACRELVSLALELYRQRGAQMADEVHTSYKLGDLRGSAKLGCHLCAILEVALLQQIWEGRPSVAAKGRSETDGWGLHYTVQRSGVESALFMITPVIEATRYGNPVLAFPLDSVDYGQSELATPDVSKLSLGTSTGDEDTFKVALAGSMPGEASTLCRAR
jgi:hypothetical protein